MSKYLTSLALAVALSALSTMSFAQSHWNGRYCEPPRYDNTGAPYGPYCPYP